VSDSLMQGCLEPKAVDLQTVKLSTSRSNVLGQGWPTYGPRGKIFAALGHLNIFSDTI